MAFYQATITETRSIRIVYSVEAESEEQAMVRLDVGGGMAVIEIANSTEVHGRVVELLSVCRAGNLVLTDPRYLRVRFVPQAWINDYAMECDHEGPSVWRVYRQEFTQDSAEALDAFFAQDDSIYGDANDVLDHQSRDALHESHFAPAWVKTWGGPYEVRIVSDAWESDGALADGAAASEEDASDEDHRNLILAETNAENAWLRHAERLDPEAQADLDLHCQLARERS